MEQILAEISCSPQQEFITYERNHVQLSGWNQVFHAWNRKYEYVPRMMSCKWICLTSLTHLWRGIMSKYLECRIWTQCGDNFVLELFHFLLYTFSQLHYISNDNSVLLTSLCLFNICTLWLLGTFLLVVLFYFYLSTFFIYFFIFFYFFLSSSHVCWNLTLEFCCGVKNICNIWPFVLLEYTLPAQNVIFSVTTKHRERAWNM